MPRDPKEHRGALLQSVGMPACPQQEQPEVKAQRHVVRRSGNGSLKAFE